MRPSPTRLALAVYVACFAVGVTTHTRDFILYGPRPYRFAPLPLELFWSALVLLDASVVALLFAGRRRTGLGLALAVMLADVAANSSALLGMRIEMFTVPLLLQTAFLGFVLGSIGFLWPRPCARTTASR